MSGQRRDGNMAASLRWRLRRLRYVLQRISGSVAQRGLKGTVARVAQEFRHRPATDTTLALEPLDLPFAPFALPVDAAPRVSVVIPVHGQLRYTLACLRSIARHGARAPFEVIVVDDASPDESADTLARIDGLRLLRNAHNLGFVGSCNAGAADARGEFLLFLNNDTQVTPGWLDALLDCCVHEAGCGIAGSRLAYPDGRLQEAGAIIYADASAWNVGRFEDRDDPRFRWRREVDYVSGAALMIARDLFAAVGGFDTRYAPAYYEDVDLAFAVRAAGRRVVYEPRSLVVHCEGITAGTDPDAGAKRQQAVNREVFAARWADALARQPAPGTPVARAVHRQRRRILVIDGTVPEPARDSGSLRLVAIFGLLRELGWDVAFLPDDGHADASHVDALGALGVQVLCRPWVKDAPAWLRSEGAQLDAVMLCRYPVADQYAALVRRHAPQAKLLFDTVDLHFLREQRAAEVSGSAALARRAEHSRRHELALVAASDASFVVSPHEAGLLARAAPQARVELLSNVHEVHGRHAPFADRRDLVFIGGFGHPPNADAVRWLVTGILPRIRASVPDMRLHVLGDVPDDARRELSGDGIELHGRVDTLAPYMDGCRVSVAPLRFGAGVKGKVNMAMSWGLPVVATVIAAEGMQLVDGEDVLLADDADAFAAAVLRLYHDEALWLRLSDGGLANVRRHFSPATARETLRHVLD